MTNNKAKTVVPDGDILLFNSGKKVKLGFVAFSKGRHTVIQIQSAND